MFSKVLLLNKTALLFSTRMDNFQKYIKQSIKYQITFISCYSSICTGRILKEWTF